MTYMVGDQIAEDLKAVAKLLEVPKVTKKDVSPGGQYSDIVTIMDADADDLHDTDAADPDEDTGTDASQEEPQDEQPIGDDIKSEIEASMPKFKDLAELKSFIKDIDTPTLEYLAHGVGCTWDATENAQIYRMRIAQSMHRHYFPELFTPKESKKKGKYGDLTDDKLAAMAEQHKVTWSVSAHAPINRMRLIMALKEAGHLAE